MPEAHKHAADALARLARRCFACGMVARLSIQTQAALRGEDVRRTANRMVPYVVEVIRAATSLRALARARRAPRRRARSRSAGRTSEQLLARSAGGPAAQNTLTHHPTRQEHPEAVP